MTAQLCLASTLYGVASLAAAVDAGLLGRPQRRVLVVSNNAETPEAQPGPQDQPGFAALARRFDAVESWNAVVHPFHPGQWAPRQADAPVLERLLRAQWGVAGESIELVVESIQAPPARSLARVFTDASIRLYADGLMSYGPTRTPLGPTLAPRVTEVLYLDLVPGLTPLLAREAHAPTRAVDTAAVRAIMDELAAAGEARADLPRGGALVVGQYLACLGLIGEDEERALYQRMIRQLAGLGHRSIVFKPHPSAPQHWVPAMRAAAADSGAELTVVDRPVLAEVVFQWQRPELVVGCFSTAMATAQGLFGIPTAHLGTGLVLERLRPYQNSNRLPTVLIDALHPALDAPQRAPWPSGAAGARRLAETLAYCLQPVSCDDLRSVAVAELRRDPEGYRRYVPVERRIRLGLPGAPIDFSPLLADRRVRAVARRVLGAPRSARRAMARLVS